MLSGRVCGPRPLARRVPSTCCKEACIKAPRQHQNRRWADNDYPVAKLQNHTPTTTKLFELAQGMFTNMNFGEADFQCSEVVKYLSEKSSVIMQTIDTMIQMVASINITAKSCSIHLRL